MHTQQYGIQDGHLKLQEKDQYLLRYVRRERETDTDRKNPANEVKKDFDGTIFMQDTGHVLVDNLGGGSEFREMLESQMKSGERSFREISEDMWGSLTIPLEDGFEMMKSQLEIDPKFKEFYEFCVLNGISFHVISAGLRPILRKVLDAFLGAQEVKSILLA